MRLQVELVTPPQGAAAGDQVGVAGFEGEPDKVLDPKKAKVFETVATELASNQDCIACYRGVPLSTSQGPCTVKSVVGGSIR